jgi:hypothetical protein
MADPNDKAPVEPAATSTPAVEPVAAPVAPEQAAAAPAVEPVAAAAPVPEVPAAPVAEPPAAEPTLLEAFDAEKAKEADKAKEAKPDAKPEAKVEAKPEEKAAEPAKEAAPAEPAKLEPVEYKYTLPETLKMDDALKGSLHEALDGFRTNPAEGVQKLIDIHNQQMIAHDAHLRQEQVRVFNETRKDWRTKVMADEQIGGAGYQTSMGAIARMRDMAVPEGDRADFESFLRITGAGDHPSFLKMMHNFARYFDEPGLPPPNPQPTGKDGGRAPNRRAVMYDNPRSPGNRQ